MLEKQIVKRIDSMSSEMEGQFATLELSDGNFSYWIPPVDSVFAAEADPNYEQFLADVWVGIILTLIVLSCVCCMCSCLLYHKFQQWKRSIEARNSSNVESGNPECESLPSYTVASGLPSYEEALEQLKKVKEMTKPKGGESVEEPWAPHTPPLPMSRLSVSELFQFYRNPNLEVTSKSSNYPKTLKYSAECL